MAKKNNGKDFLFSDDCGFINGDDEGGESYRYSDGRPYLEQYRTKSGIWFLDLRKPDNSPMALHGWMSPDGMEELLAADVDSRNKELKEMPYDLLTDKDGLNLRPYGTTGGS